MKEGDKLTPGRIGHVFFFPQESLKQLEGKEKGWARKTNYGRGPRTSDTDSDMNSEVGDDTD